MKATFNVIDLFAGIGGLRLGFEQGLPEGACKTVFVSEWDKFAAQTYAANFAEPAIAGDITKINAEDIPPFDICLAGFPCQAFSTAGHCKGFQDNYKGRCRGTLFFEVARICEHHKPRVILCENVKHLVHHDGGNTFRVIRETLESLGYRVFYKVLDSQNFGLAQHRERVYIVATRADVFAGEFLFPEPPPMERKPVIADVLEAEPVAEKYYIKKKELASRRAATEKWGKFCQFGMIVRSWGQVANTLLASQRPMLIIDRRRAVEDAERNREGYRILTPAECARLQGMPAGFVFPCSEAQTYKQLGNGVSVPVIRAIAEQIYQQILNHENDD